jgi:hypothetical protein
MTQRIMENAAMMAVSEAALSPSWGSAIGISLPQAEVP